MRTTFKITAAGPSESSSTPPDIGAQSPRTGARTANVHGLNPPNYPSTAASAARSERPSLASLLGLEPAGPPPAGSSVRSAATAEPPRSISFLLDPTSAPPPRARFFEVDAEIGESSLESNFLANPTKTLNGLIRDGLTIVSQGSRGVTAISSNSDKPTISLNVRQLAGVEEPTAQVTLKRLGATPSDDRPLGTARIALAGFDLASEILAGRIPLEIKAPPNLNVPHAFRLQHDGYQINPNSKTAGHIELQRYSIESNNPVRRIKISLTEDRHVRIVKSTKLKEDEHSDFEKVTADYKLPLKDVPLDTARALDALLSLDASGIQAWNTVSRHNVYRHAPAAAESHATSSESTGDDEEEAPGASS